MAKIPFKVSARAGKLLGRENFSNPEGAIIELVKNSYDADAQRCIVIFDIPTKTVLDEKGDKITIPIKDESTIFIIDNGEGMTEDVIKNHWMKIGTGNKETEFLSTNKRVRTGAKGIGRFALDRLGINTEMWTVSNIESKRGFHWKMNWNQFDDSDKSISDIEAELTSDDSLNLDTIVSDAISLEKFQELINDLSFQTGTILKITNLKDEWYSPNKENKGNINDVFRSLEALVPPKELNIPFEVFFYHIQESSEYGKVETAFFNDYDYKLKAFYDAESLNIDIEITRNELDIKWIKKDFPNVFDSAKSPYDLKTIEKKEFKYSKSIEKLLKWNLNESNSKLLKDVGSFELTFYYLKFSNSQKEGYPYKSINPTERRAVLDKFGGVKVYRDSFRVRPYGDPTNDWLKLGARVAQSPAGAGQRINDWRVRPEQTAGIISISRKTNPLLIDKSDRGALQENDAFETFKKIIVGVIHEFEYDRTKVLNPFYLYKREQEEKNKEKIIQERAAKLADEIVAKRKEVEAKIYGKSASVNLFQQKQEEEEKKSYQKAFKETFKAIDEEHAQKENEEVVQVRALASLGLVVSSFAHELKAIKNKSMQIVPLEEIFKRIIPEDVKVNQRQLYEEGLDIFELLNENTERIQHWINYSLSTIRKDKRKRGKLIFSYFFNSLENTWLSIFKEKNIVLSIVDNTFNEEYDFRAFEMDMITIFSNLINNSIDSFERQKVIRERNITIESNYHELSIEILYSDNGAGLDTIFSDKDEIFLPFTTSKKDRKGNDIGTGLGMYLVKEVINDYAGDIEILDVLEGFALRIILPIRKIKSDGEI